MLLPLTLLALAASLVATPPVEDEAHRLDRMQTRLLNERAAARLRHAAAADETGAARSAAEREEALRRREHEAVERWRTPPGCERPGCSGANLNGPRQSR